MKKALLFVLCLLPTTVYLSAQTCVRDSSIYQTTTLLAPATWTQENMAYNLAQGCIGQPYSQSITFNVPNQYEGLPISSIRMTVSNAIVDLPTGITYSCDPPNCVFLANTLGCVLLHGTPDGTNIAPDTPSIQFAVSFISNFGILHTLFPLGSDEYRIILQPAPCQSSAADRPNASIAAVRTVPNPISSIAQIEVGAYQARDFRFEVFDLLGQRVYTEPIHLEAGRNAFFFDAGSLANGHYVYTLSNALGKVSRLMVIAR